MTGDLSLLPVQQWFLEKVDKGEFIQPDHWNQSFLVRVPPLAPGKLAAVMDEIVAYHDVLRIRYSKLNGDPEAGILSTKRWKQEYQQSIEVPEFRILDVSKYAETELQDLLTDWQSHFNLEQGPLFQAGYLYGYEDGSARIYCAFHHMLVDAVSWGILSDDMKTLYEGGELPAKGSSYRQWVECVKSYAAQKPAEAIYWQEQLDNITTYPLKYYEQEPHEEFFELDKGLTRSLLQQASIAYHTEINDLLLTALAYALKEINQNDVQCITLEGHGREDIAVSIDHSRTVGWFTTMFPVKLELQNSPGESIQFIKESLRNIPNKGIGFGVFATDPATSFTFQNLAPVSFNYLGQYDIQEGDWQIAGEGSGSSIHPANSDHNLVNINGLVSNGKLWFSIVTKLGEATTKQLCESFKTELTKIIQHCSEKIKKNGSSYTPSDFKSISISQLLLTRLETAAKANQNEIAHIYPATSLQQGFIYHTLNQPSDDAYRQQLLYDFHEALDTGNFIKAWELCIRQYPILRTAFNWEEDVVQVIYKYGKLEYEEHDISHLVTQQEKDRAIEIIQVEDRKRNFDLTKPTALRLHIIKQSVASYTILRSEHHIISDGWSGPILFSNLFYYYDQLTKNKNPYIKEDTAYLKAQEYISQHKTAIEEYWEITLAEVEGANDINALLSQPIDTVNYNHVEKPETSTLELKKDIYTAIKAFSQKEGITLNVIVQFIWHKLLHVYSNSLQSIVGTTVSGRDLPIEGIEESVGLYINTLPLVIKWGNDNTILDQLHQIQQKITELNTHSFAELAKLQRDGQRIFHSLFVYENYPVPDAGKEVPETKESNDFPEISLRNAIEKVDYPLSIIAYEQAEALIFHLQYDGNYLTKERSKQYIEILEHLVLQVIENPGKPQRQVSLLRDEEYEQVIDQWNSTDSADAKDKTVYQLFREQAEKTPGNIALIFEGQQLTYQQLNEKSNQLARHIRNQYLQKTKQPLSPGTLVALYLDRGLEMVIGILAVMKAGGAYVPMDISYPQERINYLLEETGTELILSQRQFYESNDIQLPANKVIYIDLPAACCTEEDTSDLPLYSSASDLACVLFTSGTTGKPKGVMLEHLSVYNRVVCMMAHSGITAADYYLFKTNYVFDVSLSDIFTHLCAGAALQVTKYVFDLNELDKLLSGNEFTSLHLVPSQYDLLSTTINKINLQKIYFSGEALTERILSDLDKNIKVYNYYGPTETGEVTVANPLLPASASVIGKPFSNCRQYILDQNKNPVPIGVTGELYIGGACLARGYLNRSDLTAERFVPNPFATGTDKAKGYNRLYKTGDLVRWLPDGNLEYIGRNDDQVKINGYRIELAEIEHALLQVTGIRQSCVLARDIQTEGGSIKYLAGYYVLDNENDILTQDAILDRLSQMLPEHMVPGALIKIDSLPLTNNGKLDKNALPDFDFNSSEEEYVAPMSDTEASMCNIWQQALRLDRVGITDNFFRIGGNSILAIQVSHRMSKYLGCDVKVSDVFKFKDIQTLLDNLSVNRVNPDNVEWEIL